MTDMLAVFAKSLVPAQYDRAEVAARKNKIEPALNLSSLKVHHLFESGSWTHGTSIAEKSDVDYMAWAISPRPSLPSSALRAAKAAVGGCDWKINAVAVSSPVVQITYHSPPRIEVAPAWYKNDVRGHRVFWIAGRGDDWVLSAPQAHLAYVNRQNDRLGKKVKPLVRLMKAWKLHAAAPVSSFYLEMRTAEHAAAESTILYSIDLLSVFRKMIRAEFRDMNDPEQVVGRIPACASDEKRRLTLRQAGKALADLERADAAERAGDQTAYWLAMTAVFGNSFPWPDW